MFLTGWNWTGAPCRLPSVIFVWKNPKEQVCKLSCKQWKKQTITTGWCLIPINRVHILWGFYLNWLNTFVLFERMSSVLFVFKFPCRLNRLMSNVIGSNHNRAFFSFTMLRRANVDWNKMFTCCTLYIDCYLFKWIGWTRKIVLMNGFTNGFMSSSIEAGMPVLSNERIAFIDSCNRITLISSPWDIKSA